jgi:8-oxo-dGTP pyrophosphatase MutT (NUDIX family)
MPKVIDQAGVIPIRDGKICLVTSSNGQRWVIPKGMIDLGHSAKRAAIIEAWEEAGLSGDTYDNPLGIYHYEKDGRRYRVTVFRMDVTEEAGQWPEMGRQRIWLTPEQAIDHVVEMELRTLILGFTEFSFVGS